MRQRIEAEPLAQLDYATVVNDETWEEPSLVESPARAVVAARFGLTRLIDNAPLSVGSAQDASPDGHGFPDGEPGAR